MPTAANLLTSDIDPRDQPIPHRRAHAPKDSIGVRGGLDAAIARGLAYAPYADLLWCETSKPDLAEAREFAEAIHASIPAKCWPTTARRRSTGRRIWTTRPSPVSNVSSGAMGYKFQFITLAGFHALNLSMFELARGYKEAA